MIRILAVVLSVVCIGCVEVPKTSDQIQREQQEVQLAEAMAQVGMPAITTNRERRQLKRILELRDQAGLLTYTYFFSEITGKVGEKLCDSIGYPMPYATQFTNPEKFERYNISGGGYGVGNLPQADPNGLFSPASAEGTWIECRDPVNPKADTKIVYIEPRVVTFPYPRE